MCHPYRIFTFQGRELSANLQERFCMKVFLVLSLIFLPFSRAISQHTLFWGPEAGIHFSSFSDRDDYQPFLNGRVLPAAGIQARYLLTDSWSIRTGIRANMTGFRRSGFINTFFSGNVPLMVNYETGAVKNRPLRAFIGAGVRVSYIFAALHSTEAETTDLRPYINPIRFEAGLEAGIRRSFTEKGSLSLAICIFPGIAEIIPFSTDATLNLPSLRGMIAGLGLSWQWKHLFKTSEQNP